MSLKTIKLQGKDYCPVNERLKAFNHEYKNGSIRTELKSVNDTVLVTCTVIPDIEKLERYFTASSYGKLGAVKALEKLETVAVGRALAYLGFGVDGSVASYEEIENFIKNENQENQEQTQTQETQTQETQTQETQTQETQTQETQTQDEKIDWLTEEQYQSAKDFSIEQLEVLLTRKQSSAGNKFKMKKVFRESLLKILEEKKASFEKKI